MECVLEHPPGRSSVAQFDGRGRDLATGANERR
jgi:hypothetical protein